MGLPFVETISIARKRPPQKTQENSVHQCRNLDGKFLIDEESVQSGPVLLIDDIVDSRWTLTICAALLRKYNSGPVLPAVLATTNPGSV
jgi:ATP-dependent DNA helicase RecQ